MLLVADGEYSFQIWMEAVNEQNKAVMDSG
jgi:hypothetical protein